MTSTKTIISNVSKEDGGFSSSSFTLREVVSFLSTFLGVFSGKTRTTAFVLELVNQLRIELEKAYSLNLSYAKTNALASAEYLKLMSMPIRVKSEKLGLGAIGYFGIGLKKWLTYRPYWTSQSKVESKYGKDFYVFLVEVEKLLDVFYEIKKAFPSALKKAKEAQVAHNLKKKFRNRGYGKYRGPTRSQLVKPVSAKTGSKLSKPPTPKVGRRVTSNPTGKSTECSNPFSLLDEEKIDTLLVMPEAKPKDEEFPPLPKAKPKVMPEAKPKDEEFPPLPKAKPKVMSEAKPKVMPEAKPTDELEADIESEIDGSTPMDAWSDEDDDPPVAPEFSDEDE